jgi:hypothetical protein
MAKKRTKAQKINSKSRIKVVKNVVSSKNKTKQDFIDQEKDFIVRDLGRTIVYTLIVIAVLLSIFVYTKTS